MNAIRSNAQRVHEINGHTITGLASDDRPIEYPTGDELVTIEVGQDGGVYGQEIPMFGGPVTYRLQPSSPSVQWFINERKARDEANINGTELTVYNGTETDPAVGESIALRGGRLLQAPHKSEPGQTYEAVIYYERIIPDVDAAKFNPPFTA